MSTEIFREINKAIEEKGVSTMGVQMHTIDIKRFAGDENAIGELISLCREVWGRQDIGGGMRFLANDQTDTKIFITLARDKQEILGFCVFKLFRVSCPKIDSTYTFQNILYFDHTAVRPEKRNSGLGTDFHLNAIEEVSKDGITIVDLILSRTQNPLVESSLSAALKKSRLGWTELCPLRIDPSGRAKKMVGEVIASGKMPKKADRPNSSFDNKSFIFWGAYGDGTGSTWENMTRSAGVDWKNPKAKLFLKHLSRNGLTVERFLNEGHALVIASERVV